MSRYEASSSQITVLFALELMTERSGSELWLESRLPSVAVAGEVVSCHGEVLQISPNTGAWNSCAAEYRTGLGLSGRLIAPNLFPFPLEVPLAYSCCLHHSWQEDAFDPALKGRPSGKYLHWGRLGNIRLTMHVSVACRNCSCCLQNTRALSDSLKFLSGLWPFAPRLLFVVHSTLLCPSLFSPPTKPPCALYSP